MLYTVHIYVAKNRHLGCYAQIELGKLSKLKTGKIGETIPRRGGHNEI